MREIDIFQHDGRNSVERLAVLASDHKPSHAFDHQYYDAPNGTYGGYRYDGRYREPARKMVVEFDLAPGSRILEIGCAKGFTLLELHRLGMKVRGLEVSRYAVENCHPELEDRITQIEPGEWPAFWRPFDFVLCKEVLPHISEEWLPKKIRYLNAVARKSFLEIQTAGSPEAAENMKAWDVTHQTCKPAQWWRDLLTANGYRGAVQFKALF